MTTAIDISVERVYGSGALRLSTIHNDQYVTQLYMGYSKRVAMTMFRQHVRKQTGGTK